MTRDTDRYAAPGRTWRGPNTITEKRPVLRTWARAWRDVAADADPRRRLGAFVSHSDPAADAAHAWWLLGWLLRVALPALLDEAGHQEDAIALRAALPAMSMGTLAPIEHAFCGASEHVRRAVAALGLPPRPGSSLALDESGITAAVEALDHAPAAFGARHIATSALVVAERVQLLAAPRAAVVARIRESGLLLLETLGAGEAAAAAEE